MVNISDISGTGNYEEQTTSCRVKNYNSSGVISITKFVIYAKNGLVFYDTSATA